MAASDFLSCFSMKNMPFTTSIGTDFLYKNPLQNDVKQKLGLTVDSNSFALLTGRPGIGKSTALRLFTSSLNPDNYLIFYVSISNPTPRWLYTVPLEAMGVKPHIYVNDARRQFHQEIMIQKKTYNRKVIMIIDEAHLLTQSYHKYNQLEEIRFLLNGEDKYDSGSPLSLILADQSEICDILNNEKCTAITQRIQYVCNLQPLKNEQIEPYITAHLRWAGVTEQLFSSESVTLLAELSEGIPRMLNKICLHSLNYAALKNARMVTPDIIELAAGNEVIEFMLKNGKLGTSD